MQACLLRIENLEPLEHILSQEAEELGKLEQVTSELKLDQAIGSNELTETFSRIREDINAFLQVDKVRVPSLAPFSLFDGTNGDIVRSYASGFAWLGAAVAVGTSTHVRNRHKQKKGDSPTRLSRRAFLLGAIPAVPGAGYLVKAAVFHRQRRNDGAYLAHKEEISYGLGYGKAKTLYFIAHEYTHHVQHVTGFYYRKGLNPTLALEGHARGVDRYLSRLFVEQFDMRGYLYYYLKTSVEELIHSYLWMCNQLKQSPNAALVTNLPKSQITPDQPRAHGPGHALFRIHAQDQGEQIYADLVNGCFVLS